MQTKRKSKLTGVALALAAAGLAGCASQGGSTGPGATTDLVHCYGVNRCNGHNDCKSAQNGCAGQASCKGQGFVAIPSKACKDIGGTTKDSWKGSVSTANFLHCYGLNVCKGHNDCKSSNNACAGQASCKGQGFVSVPAKACNDLGGQARS